MQSIQSNEVFVVSVNRDTFGGGPTTFLDVVEKFQQYFHPIGSRWPVSPPNYMGFRWHGKLQSIHHIDSYEIMTDYKDHFPAIIDGKIQPHFLYHLGPAIRPNHEVRSGKGMRAGRVWAHIDLLLTSKTIPEAALRTKDRLAAAANR